MTLNLETLPGIHADLARIDEDWKKWTFLQLVDTLRKWIIRNSKIIPILRKVSNVKMHVKQMIKIISTATVFIVRNLGKNPVTAKQ